VDLVAANALAPNPHDDVLIRAAGDLKGNSHW
jgi:hypothetical protein